MQSHTHNQGNNESPMRGGEYNQNESQHFEGGSPGSDYQQNQQYMGGEQQEEGGEVTKRLVGSRQARKQAEEDVKLLGNRIALLKMEEKKAWKKIEDTKKKAKDIMSVRQRNQDTVNWKDQKQKEKEENERTLAERNAQMKNQMKEQIQMSKEQLLQKCKEDAERLKMEKMEQKEMMNMQKQQEQIKNASLKQMIRNQEQEVGEKKRKEQEEKKTQGRQQLIQKILDENQKRINVEAQVDKMEKEELDLIQKLQNTQMLQKAAYEDLECALNAQGSPDKQGSQSSSSMNREFSPVKASMTGSDSKNGVNRPATQGQIDYGIQSTVAELGKSKYYQDLNRSQLLPALNVKPSHMAPSTKTHLTKEILNLADVNGDKYTSYGSPSQKFDKRDTRSVSMFKSSRQSNDGGSLKRSQKSDRTMFKMNGISKLVSVPTDSHSSHTVAISGQRRVHEDGIKMLDEQYNLKLTQNQVTIMENRIKRLVYEEQRAKKLAEQASYKAEMMLDARQRHQNVLYEKFQFYENNMKWVCDQKDRNLEQKLITKSQIEKSKNFVLNKKFQVKQDIVELERYLDAQRTRDKIEDQTQKRQKKIKVLIERNIGMSKKLEETSQYNKQLKVNYGHKFIAKIVKEDQGTDRIKKLEQVETQLLDRLKHTHSQQRSQYKNLEKIVHEGYNYYLNSFAETREMKIQQYSGLRSKFCSISSRNDQLPSSKTHIPRASPL